MWSPSGKIKRHRYGVVKKRWGQRETQEVLLDGGGQVLLLFLFFKV